MNSNIFFSEKSGLFTINIPRSGFTINDANSEFSDGFFVYWTYPFEVYMSDELKRIFSDITNPNLTDKTKKFEGYINIEGVVHPAILKLLGSIGKLGKFQFEFGIETLPSFEKKLTDFDFGSIQSTSNTNIYDYIDANIGKYYPEVNVFFPRIHTVKYADKAIGNGFLFNGVYNDLENGLIKRNSITDLGFINNGIVKPIVSLMHVLKQALASDGYEAVGEILTDEDFLYSGLDHNNEAFDIHTQEQFEAKITVKAPTGYNYVVPPNNIMNFDSSTTAYFNVIGNYYFSLYVLKDNIKDINGTVSIFNPLGYWQTIATLNFSSTGQPSTYEINIQQLLPTFDELTQVKVSLSMTCFYDVNLSNNQTKIAKFYLNPKRAGEISSQDYFQLKNALYLNLLLPDITFGDLLKAIKLWKKYKIIPDGKKLHFKKIETIPSKIIDLQFSEQEDLEISSSYKDAYLLKLEAPSEYGYTTYTIDKDQVYTFEKEFNDRTDVVINGYPLPIVDVNGINTAMEKTTDTNGVVLIKYKGLQSGKNDSLPLTNLLIPNIYTNYYELYIKNRLASDTLKWSFYTDDYRIRELTSSDVIYAYNSNHKILNIIKKFVEPKGYLIEIETENRY